MTMDRFFSIESHGNCCEDLYLNNEDILVAQSVMGWTDEEMIRFHTEGFTKKEAQEICRAS